MISNIINGLSETTMPTDAGNMGGRERLKGGEKKRKREI